MLYLGAWMEKRVRLALRYFRSRPKAVGDLGCERFQALLASKETV